MKKKKTKIDRFLQNRRGRRRYALVEQPRGMEAHTPSELHLPGKERTPMDDRHGLTTHVECYPWRRRSSCRITVSCCNESRQLLCHGRLLVPAARNPDATSNTRLNMRRAAARRGKFFLSSAFFFSSRRRHTRCLSDWSSDVCSSD